SDERITFIDTPGHAAFTEMRARGANVTDIVVLVVAADDGVMAQTIEAIRHAQAAEVPMVVAINKVDRPGADPQRVKHELLNHGVVVEELGGETLAVEISARERRNLDRLQEAILLQAELLEIKANPLRRADGVVLEAKLDHRRGPVATLLVQGGTLRQGDALIAGSEWGRVRALVSERGERVDQALPGQPVEVLGLAGTPRAGDGFVVVDDEPRAREIGTFRQRKQREAELLRMTRGTLEQRLSQIKKGETKELPIIVKADVQGSLEAIMGNLQKLQSDDVTLHVLHAAAGGINESDVSLAQANDGMIVAFNVRPTPRARQLAERNGVEIRAYAIIHELVDA
ncbi:MAG: translation initiation factor IF-2, partial [Nitrospirota bacterium]|nr:translation initiation factor IF-2 [Nitrospirota bacterium]